MSPGTYDLGIHLEDISPFLLERGAVKIVGYERSGKSTLAETLVRELQELDTTVVHQNATAWLGQASQLTESAGQAASVDPELAQAISRLEAAEDACWVVDDAEVLVAYATDDLLRSVGRKIMSGRFSVILIRNRFVQEHAGWFYGREALLYADLPTLFLEPLPGPAALRAAQAFYTGPSAEAQATWLVTMSGGIPGLMSELAPFAPAWVGAPPSRYLQAHAMRRREDLGLHQALRSALVRALQHRILPPGPMLSATAQAELGALEIAGLVHPRYAQRSDPFRGQFWRLVCGEAEPLPMPDDAVNAGVELEIIVRDLGVAAELAATIGLDEPDEGDLANAFACSLTCQRAVPGLVRPLAAILADNLGKAQIADVLDRRAAAPDLSASSHELAARLLTTMGLT
jgi:hypothetical protein